MGRRLQALTPLAPDAEEGSLALTAPNGFGFRVGDFEICRESLLQRKERLLWDDETFPASEATCRVTGDGQRLLSYTLINAKPLLEGITYSLASTVKRRGAVHRGHGR